MKNFILLCALIVFSSTAQAGFLLEPYVGMHLNSTFKDNDSTTCTTCDGSISGIALGGRAGFQNLGFMFGVSGKRVSYNLENSTQGNLATTTLGLFAGYDFPILLRVWGEYIVSGTGAYDDDSANTKLNVQNGTNLGLGYKISPFISLNLEVGNLHFNEYTNDTTSGKVDVDFNTYMLGISFPLTL